MTNPPKNELFRKGIEEVILYSGMRHRALVNDGSLDPNKNKEDWYIKYVANDIIEYLDKNTPTNPEAERLAEALELSHKFMSSNFDYIQCVGWRSEAKQKVEQALADYRKDNK